MVFTLRIPFLAAARGKGPRQLSRAGVLLCISVGGSVVSLLLLLAGHAGLAVRAYSGTILVLLLLLLRWSR